MYMTRTFRSTEALDTWLNCMYHFEIVGYQALWRGSALGTEIIVTIKL